MGLFDLKHVKGRNERRKQSKAGRFNTEHLQSSKEQPEYNLPKVSENKLNQIKNNIKEKIKEENKKRLTTLIIIIFFLIFLLYYLNIFEYFNRYVFRIVN